MVMQVKKFMEMQFFRQPGRFCVFDGLMPFPVCDKQGGRQTMPALESGAGAHALQDLSAHRTRALNAERLGVRDNRTNWDATGACGRIGSAGDFPSNGFLRKAIGPDSSARAVWRQNRFAPE
jgi:hypothetical protein